MDYDVIVVGAGNAALAASVSAREAGAKRVLVLEKAPQEQRGGNTHFSGGLLRFAFGDVRDLQRLVPHAEEEWPGFTAGVEAYPEQAFLDDLMRMTSGRTDRELAEILISRSYETVCWMHEVGKIPMEPAVSLGAVRVDGVLKWPTGAIIRAVHEGVGLSRHWFATAEAVGVEIRYDHGATGLIQDAKGRVTGVLVRSPDGLRRFRAGAVVLGAGGFEANMAWRARYLGRPWDHAKVRGTRHNQGDGLRMALDIGALPSGQWTGCHATPISADAPDYGKRELTDKTNRLSYPYGVMLNLEGKRFVDEAADHQFYTYAKYGGMILNQAGSLVYQIFDGKVLHLLEPRYATSTPYQADTLDELLTQLKLDPRQAACTLAAYNEAAGHGAFVPGVLDGMHTEGLEIPKSNWAQKLDTPPFVAYPVTGGITFTFGGLKVNERAQALGTDWRPIPGLFVCGEMVGGLFHYNYPGGTGLVSGAVFGRAAGASAAGA
ncbi:MAG: FAD-dependent tricarballylate dehydrogenase TcuA [Gemmatimonadetes bacterium]|nr:FAD-dependent tricarballylate dehydrogenase TcuA [Gemmatimonadota bacterium]